MQYISMSIHGGRKYNRYLIIGVYDDGYGVYYINMDGELDSYDNFSDECKWDL